MHHTLDDGELYQDDVFHFEFCVFLVSKKVLRDSELYVCERMETTVA